MVMRLHTVCTVIHQRKADFENTPSVENTSGDLVIMKACICIPVANKKNHFISLADQG